MNKLFGTVVSSAIAGALSASSFANEAAKKPADSKTAEMACQNNSCKGKADCKGFGNDACGGANSCKGKGALHQTTEKACTEKGGKWVAKK